jgi:hypothetical protein
MEGIPDIVMTDSTETMRFEWHYFEGVWALDENKLDITV